VRKPSVKRTFRIDAALSRQLDDRARSRKVTRTDVVEAALASLLTPDQEERLEAVLGRRLDRLGRQLDRIEWQLDLSNEAFVMFVRSWFANSPPLPDAALRASQASSKKRWAAFIDALSRRMELGPKLRDELSREVDGGD
jgi:uncharacterized membrane protein YebE (DUF533 family)